MKKYFHFTDMPQVPYIFPIVSTFSVEFLTRLQYGSNVLMAQFIYLFFGVAKSSEIFGQRPKIRFVHLIIQRNKQTK